VAAQADGVPRTARFADHSVALRRGVPKL